jgi:RHH-type proline utilization regulon transcriptional repressor/proline dehydrogenase/delta 1-pyrroline-5-carboxylate dehydrogenase
MAEETPTPFSNLASAIPERSPLRRAITAATRRAEPDRLPPLLPLAQPTPDEAAATAALAKKLVEGLRRRGSSGGVEALMREYALSSQEGVALMCLAEALLRTPDDATRDALIRDKVAAKDWRAHLGQSPSLFVNAATWGLLVTGRLAATNSETGLAAALGKLMTRSGEPVVRAGVEMAMWLLGKQFVAGRTIGEALENAGKLEAQGFRHSYDMLGEAATTAEDAARYMAAYEDAIHAIGKAAAGRGPVAGPGVSIKLSALHPRYSRQKRERVMAELFPRAARLASLARSYGIGLNIDAEEADRLEISLDVFEALALDPVLAGWDGLGFVIQAYGKRCPEVVDWLVDLARRSGRRLMVRLVKGAYWDSEIKRAQVDGFSDFPVFTRKAHSDVCYLACARKLLAAGEAVFPQFATHNAQTLAAVAAMGEGVAKDAFEFQCLHGMGEPLYELAAAEGLGRACRIYAPVGSHETLLAYLVRRLLENGANASFVNRVADETTSVEDLIADPVAIVRAEQPPGAPNPKIRKPPELFGASRKNSLGLDLADEDSLAQLAAASRESALRRWEAGPSGDGGSQPEPVRNPADRRDVVGLVRWSTPADIAAALSCAEAAAPGWAATSQEERAACLRRAADAIERRTGALVGLMVREAGKTFANGVSEVREAVDFLRFYANEAELLEASRPLGIVAAISPWNFPLAIFTGQVAAALGGGNAVLAKPAEETPLVAAEAVRILHAAGVPEDALQLLPGDGETGAALVTDGRVEGVAFTGSFEAAKAIQKTLAKRLTRDGRPIPFVAETGGRNVMIVDSSALAEQVVLDVLASAFDSAGQRCSALRILSLQDDVADRILEMLKGAARELEVGPPENFSTDVGPLISEEAKERVERHLAEMRARGFRVTQAALPEACAQENFVAPTIVEIGAISDVMEEVFGPVLHVARHRAEDLDRVVDEANASGHALTFGLHTRIDETVARVTRRVVAGNLYVNRNIVGAVVGVQPFGGSGLSGTGPKAGGPLAVGRFLAEGGVGCGIAGEAETLALARAYAEWLKSEGLAAAAKTCRAMAARSPLGGSAELPGPVGERNVYRLEPKGRIAAVAESEHGAAVAIGAVLAAGSVAVVEAGSPVEALAARLPEELRDRVEIVSGWRTAEDLGALVFEGGREALLGLLAEVAERPGPIVTVHARAREEIAAGAAWDVERLVEERTVSTNTAAGGGDATLLSAG